MPRFERSYETQISAPRGSLRTDYTGLVSWQHRITVGLANAGFIGEEIAEVRSINFNFQRQSEYGECHYKMLLTLIERADDVVALEARGMPIDALRAITDVVLKSPMVNGSGDWSPHGEIVPDKKVEDPTVRPDHTFSGTRYEHPAFGQISLSRVTGGAILYGSDFRHNRYISLKINTSELSRSLNSDRMFAGRAIMEVLLSEAQWATFVSSMGIGEGVPCTIAYREGQRVPELPPPAPKSEVFKTEYAETMKEAVSILAATTALVDSQGLPKAKAAAIREGLEKVRMRITSSAQFAAKQFEEHVEGVVEAAKAEIHGYTSAIIQEKGLEAIAAEKGAHSNGGVPVIEYGGTKPVIMDEGAMG